jgi:lysophospholipase L1-like esterase
MPTRRAYAVRHRRGWIALAAVAATFGLATSASAATTPQALAVHAVQGAAAASPLQVRASATPGVVETSSLRLEPLGDSITYGYQSTTGNGYREPLWNELTGEGHPLDFVGSVQGGTMADPDNEGHSGWRIDQIAAITDSSLATYKPNVVTLMIGTNDLNQSYQVSTAPARLSALVSQIVADDPTATVLVANLIVSTSAPVAAAEPAYNAAIPPMVAAEQSAGHHVALVDMSALTPADLADSLHPNDAGYQLMADAWNKGIQAADAAGWITPPVALSGSPVPGTASSVQSGIAGKCLDVNTGSSADGTAVQIYGCNHTAAQAWTPYSDNTLHALGKCLDATGGGTVDGTLTQLYDCNGTGAQVWQSYDGGYRNMASGLCLDDPGSSATDGTQLQLWDCNGGPNQQWTPQPLAGPITSGISGKCLDDNGGSSSDGAVVDLWDCNNTAAQQWSSSSGTIQVNGKCLDVTGGATTDGALVELWDCNGGANQVWNVVGSTLVNPASGKCLDDPGFSSTNGTQLDIWDCNAGANQEWTPTTF